ncbi:MAG: MaoC family dehydratase [Marinisporobacter sp.]|jgi:3-hydroxybutyryl-CoA dehydratase|nr:MaoC family dehydratase [Marinisporobacter sp.]
MVADKKYEEMEIGQTASLSKKITNKDIMQFANISGDRNPIHIDEHFALKSRFKKRIAHGMLTSSLISAVLGTELPGANTLYLSQNMKFLAPAYIGDELTASVEVMEKKDEKKLIILKTIVKNQSGNEIITGQAVVKKM